jgi:hypothetical protein
MIESGATSDKYRGTRPDGVRIISCVLQKTPSILQIQAEMETGAMLTETTVGREVRLDCRAGGPVQSKIQTLKFEVKQAQEARDLAMYERRLKDQ